MANIYKRSLCQRCGHHICATEVNTKFRVSGASSKAVAKLNYVCGICGKSGYLVVKMSDYWDKLQESGVEVDTPLYYKTLYKFIITDKFTPENPAEVQAHFEQINKSPITKEECQNFHRYLEQSNTCLKDLRKLDSGINMANGN
jgi:DNA-directed RNA polymerase subunit RPC12/RpoP